jgi:predicted phage terminase large subunit-like protein
MNLEEITKAIEGLPAGEQEGFMSMLSEYENSLKRERAQKDFMAYVKEMWPGFVNGRHHKIMAKKFQDIAEGRLKRLIICMPPRHTKSEFASYLLPSWFLGKYPQKKVIQSSNTADLAVGFGRKVRNLVDSEQYSKVFPNVGLRSDSKAAGRWSTNHNGEYFAIGVGGTVTGKGADLLIIDDPHSEQEAKLAQSNSEVFDQVYEWYTSGPRQRLQPGGAIVIVQTRWSKKDLVGRILQSSMERDGETWELIEFPAILPSGNPLWPEFWSYEELAALRDELPAAKWNAQYQQSPTSEEGALIKREWWKEWTKEDPPSCQYLLQSWDTAFSKSERADYSACTTWGVFYPNENPEDPNIILLDAFKKRMEFPELKEIALRYYKEWEPDSFIVEAKASGAPLIYELRAMGIPVQEFTPTRGNDKIVRVNAISDLFASGKVWAPPKRWAEEVIEELAAFPNAQHDDFVDSCLVGETNVLMADKTYKRIDQINIGDFVMTPNGSRRVTAVFDNGQKEVWKVKVGNCVLYATANHKIKTTKGWLRVDCLSQANYNGYIFNGDLLWLLQNKTLLNLNQLFLMVENTIVILKAQTLHTANILQERVTGFIGMFGCSIRAIFQKVMKFTTLTGIQPTMTFQTWSVWKENCIKKNTNTKCRNEGNCHNNWSILPTLDLKRRLGIPPKKALLGTNSTPKILLEKHGAFQKHMLNFKQRVFGAAALLWQKFSLKNIAQPDVNRQNQNIAPVNLAQNTHSIQNVYDITVEGEHCYYANNILVHNCSQALLRFRKGGFIRLQTDEIDEPRSFRRKGAYY